VPCPRLSESLAKIALNRRLSRGAAPHPCGSAAWTSPSPSWPSSTAPRRLSRAVKGGFDKPLIQRCQQHKIKNVKDKLPERLRTVTERRMCQAYHAKSALKAEGLLEQLARELDKTHPGAAASLREGMAETLTILRLDVPPTLARTLRSTNPIVIWGTVISTV
jgi:hypothetical protein